MEGKKKYDFLIIGAGPAGLTAGIVAARKGHSVIIIEKGNKAGPKPRGEGMGYFPIVDTILGQGFLPSIGIKSSGGRVWHSPGDKQKTITHKDYTHFFFEWRKFIDRFVEKLKEAGGSLLLNSEVIAPIEKNGKCIGLKYIRDGKTEEFYGKVIFDCSGYEGVIAKNYGIDYEEMICPITKCLISNANYDLKTTPDLQFYFIGNGDLTHAPEFPPCVAYFFPLDGNRAEVGLMLRMTQIPKMKTVKIPNEREIMEVWTRIKKDYPGFHVFFINAKTDYEEVTYLPNAKMADKFVPYPGVIIAGDSAGFVNPFGSSGLYYSMEMAKMWLDMISEKLNDPEPFSPENIEMYTTQFMQSSVYEEVSHFYNLIGAFEYMIFNRMRTSERINKKWDYISSLLEQA